MKGYWPYHTYNGWLVSGTNCTKLVCENSRFTKLRLVVYQASCLFIYCFRMKIVRVRLGRGIGQEYVFKKLLRCWSKKIELFLCAFSSERFFNLVPTLQHFTCINFTGVMPHRGSKTQTSTLQQTDYSVLLSWLGRLMFRPCRIVPVRSVLC